jgi:hypothetical protein
VRGLEGLVFEANATRIGMPGRNLNLYPEIAESYRKLGLRGENA